MTPEVTVISLIYQSPEYAVGFWKYLKENTPELANGKAVFYFVANNANRKTIRALDKNEIPYIPYTTPVLEDFEHEAKGFAAPEYLGRVYSAYNFGIRMCETPLVVLLNSDMILSDNWLTLLLESQESNSILSPTLVERSHPRFGVFPGAIEANFGSSFRTFKQKAWQAFIEDIPNDEATFKQNGPYMPALFKVRWFHEICFYPEGNTRRLTDPYEQVLEYGDEYLFRKFQESGVNHVSHSKVFCYHFKEGERATKAYPLLLNLISFLKGRIKRLAASVTN